MGREAPKEKWFCLGGGDLLRVVVQFTLQAPQDPVASFQGGGRIAQRIVQAGRLGKPGEKCALGKREVGKWFAKVEVGRFPAALSMVSVIETIEISRDDLFLGPLVFKVSCSEGFAKLGEDVPPGRERTDLDQLLGDGGGA